MTSADRWLLPEGVEEILPPEALKLESLRRQILDLYATWGYQLVIPPLIEFLDSLLIGTSHDLDLHTFKITDQLSGRMMGIRADITPQVARIDAHSLNREGPARLCYADNVLHTRPRGLLSSRVPFRIGAELYGHSGVDCDIELICLMYRTLADAEVSGIHLVLGHVGIFRTLVDAAQVSKDMELSLFDALQRKAYGDIDAILDKAVSDKDLRHLLYQLSRLSGDEETLQEAIEVFRNAPLTVRKEIEELAAIAEGVKRRIPGVTLCFDLCELRGYEYHTGIVFAAYTPEFGRAVAKGGRYDHIGEAFGRARPASGFDCDLQTLARLSRRVFATRPVIVAPTGTDVDLLEYIERLRADGEIVLINLSREEMPAAMLDELNCDRRIVKKGKSWGLERVR
ncbi:MAG: ATP phosphoribosyltransferase regulatory subunit, partial [Pseudohongiellaceae bacterium]